MPRHRSKFRHHQRPRRTHERAFFSTGGSGLVAGVDEVGRGAWAGPVVAAAIILPEPCGTRLVRDSKLLTAAERTQLATRLMDRAVDYGIGEASVAEITTHGLTWAVRQSALRALENLCLPPSAILLDGHHNYLAESHPSRTIIGGDRSELCIAAASVIAKVHRDRLMQTLEQSFPGYNFAVHKGYGTASHQDALRRQGPAACHRLNYAPIRALSDTLQAAI